MLGCTLKDNNTDPVWCRYYVQRGNHGGTKKNPVKAAKLAVNLEISDG